jgi:hypothetical protein
VLMAHVVAVLGWVKRAHGWMGKWV